MIIEHQTLNLFGHKVFELLKAEAPFNKANQMNDEACFLHIFEGQGIALSEIHSLSFQANDAFLMKRGNHF